MPAPFHPSPRHADLHAHTTASDGTLTPAELVARAQNIGLSYLAVTDHDTTAGVDPALDAARDTSLEVNYLLSSFPIERLSFLPSRSEV